MDRHVSSHFAANVRYCTRSEWVGAGEDSRGLDYVVAGFGLGAILALIGFALWEVFGSVEEPGRSWLSRVAIGLMLGSLVIWAITGVSLISHIDDSTGARLVLLTTLVTLISVAAGSFWYWRADRALAATRPRPERISMQREGAAVAAPLGAIEDVELTDWDSWPERDADKTPETDSAAPEAATPESFEPEVAAEAPEVAQELAQIEPDPPEENVAVADEDDLEPEVVAPADVEMVAESVPSELPSNVRPFRAPAPVPSEPVAVVEEDLLVAETVDIAMVELPEAIEIEDEAPATVAEEPVTLLVAEAEVEAPDLLQDGNGDEVPMEADEIVPPEGFESSLLSDIDGSLVDDEGAYRSPLLSDLGSDKLEGIGLAKWRPEARLTDEDEADSAPPAKRIRRR